MRKRGLHKIKKPAKGYTAKAHSGFDIKDCLIHSQTNTAGILERRERSQIADSEVGKTLNNL